MTGRADRTVHHFPLVTTIDEIHAQGRSVLILTPVLLVGGTEVQTLNLVRALFCAGYDVTVGCYYEHDRSMMALMEEAGARVDLLQELRANGMIRLFRRLTAYFRERHPDIVHVQYVAPGLIPVLAARVAGVRTVFSTVHQPGRTYGWKTRLYLKFAASLCTSFFCNSLAVERSWFGDSSLFDPESTLKRRHWTIYNAVDAEKIAAIAATADMPALRSEFGLMTGPVIGCVGRLRHEKGQILLLDAMAEVINTIAMARLLVVGDGPDADALKRHATQRGMQNHIIWCGKTDAERVYHLYRLMDVVAVPSVFEGFGLVAAEAMAAGRAVVASAVDGLAEVVEDGVTGLLVSPGDSTALATALIDLLQHPAKAVEMGRQGKARVRELFPMERYRESILAVYAQCVNRGQGD